MSIFTNTDAETIGQKLYSAACERNKEPILTALQPHLASAKTVLEVGSGSGQHAVFFGAALPNLDWYTADIPVNHGSIRAWIAEAGLANVHPPITLNVNDAPWSLLERGLPVAQVDVIYTSNTLHIISWSQVVQLFDGLGALLNPGGLLCIYGPFKYGGEFSSDGDARFDELLKRQNDGSGLRDFEAVNELAGAEGLHLLDDVPMPANNRLLFWQKKMEFVIPSRENNSVT